MLKEDFSLAAGLPSEEAKQQLYQDIASATESGWDFSSRCFVCCLKTVASVLCREDFSLAAGLPSEEAKQQLYRDIASAAESGWDFSSRWFADGQSLSTIRTTKVVPADLNSLLFLLASDIASFAHTLGDTALKNEFQGHANRRCAAVNDLMWCEASGCWHDLLLQSSAPETLEAKPPAKRATAAESSSMSESSTSYSYQQLQQMYASNWVPLWCGCTRGPSDQYQSSQGGGGVSASACVRGLQSSGLLAPWGVLTSKYDTGQQWDAPNAWPPLQHMVIESLSSCADDVTGAAELAASLAQCWVANNCAAYRSTGHMHEKYSALECGKAGDGGEYAPQVGFGWSNGVLLDLLKMYPDQKAPPLPEH
eukprot:gene15299-21384_t